MSVQLISVKDRKSRRFTAQQKLKILKEWEQSGNGVVVVQKHQIHPSLIDIPEYYWDAY